MRVFDESKNVLLELERVLPENVYRCSKCLKRYESVFRWSKDGIKECENTPKPFLKHSCSCSVKWQDGVNKIEDPSKEMRKVIDNLGVLSKYAQGLLSPMTTGRGLNKGVYVYAEKGKCLGFITCSERFGKYSLDDFFVMDYAQRRGVGAKLFDAMISDIGLRDKEAILGQLVVCSPSEKCRSFLLKKGMEGIKVW